MPSCPLEEGQTRNTQSDCFHHNLDVKLKRRGASTSARLTEHNHLATETSHFLTTHMVNHPDICVIACDNTPNILEAFQNSYGFHQTYSETTLAHDGHVIDKVLP